MTDDDYGIWMRTEPLRGSGAPRVLRTGDTCAGSESSYPYGIRARLAWYWRRLLGKPWQLTYLQPPVGFYSATIDRKPLWRKPAPPDWSQWQQVGATTDSVPEAFRRRNA
jgi:hypothetical protein